MGAASRLAEVRATETYLARFRHALSLVSQLDEGAAFELYPREHRAICAWLWRSYRAGTTLRDAVPSGLAFEQRVLDLHLPRAEQATPSPEEGLGAFELGHLTALLRADLLLGGLRRGSKPQVEAAFERAAELATSRELELLVLRDRARFRAAGNECVKAMSDYRRLFEAQGATDDLVGIPDLRTAIGLLGRLDEPAGPGRSSTACEACDLLGRLIRTPAWRAEPASVRMQDIRDLIRAGLDSKDAQRLLHIESSLASLPLTQIEVDSDLDPVPLWFGLIREPAWFQELLDLRARVRIGLRELGAQG